VLEQPFPDEQCPHNEKKIHQSSFDFQTCWPHFFLDKEMTGSSTERTTVWFVGHISKPGFCIVCF